MNWDTISWNWVSIQKTCRSEHEHLNEGKANPELGVKFPRGPILGEKTILIQLWKKNPLWDSLIFAVEGGNF
jgi:hypothetical protein